MCHSCMSNMGYNRWIVCQKHVTGYTICKKSCNSDTCLLSKWCTVVTKYVKKICDRNKACLKSETMDTVSRRSWIRYFVRGNWFKMLCVLLEVHIYTFGIYIKRFWFFMVEKPGSLLSFMSKLGNDRITHLSKLCYDKTNMVVQILFRS